MRYELILCDLGGVLVMVQSDRLIRRLAGSLGCSIEDVREAVYHPELLLPLELGRISPRTYCDGLARRLGLAWTYAEFVQGWNEMLYENLEATALIQRLQRASTLIALTNTNVLHLEHMKTRFPALAVFHDWVASCEVGCRKPDAQIYHLALRRVGVPPQRAVYIDDRPELVEAGRAVGLTAIRFESAPQLERELQALGLLSPEPAPPPACPACGNPRILRKCKLVCARCGYFESYADLI